MMGKICYGMQQRGAEFSSLSSSLMINPRLMPVPTMIIHGQYDDVSDLDGLLPFFRQLPHPSKRYVVVPDAGHMMYLQKGHQRFQYEVAAFLKAP
jgi:pimeloyl-ACP methyl ester carboxylesterase